MPGPGRKQMDIVRLAEILDAWGADSRRWPADEREAALALLAGSEAARALRADAASLDMLLDLAVAPAPSPALMAAIMAGAEPAGWRRWLAEFWPVGPAWQPASAFAAALVLGVAIGIGAPDIVLPDTGDSAIADVESLALGPSLNLDNGL